MVGGIRPHVDGESGGQSSKTAGEAAHAMTVKGMDVVDDGIGGRAPAHAACNHAVATVIGYGAAAGGGKIGNVADRIGDDNWQIVMQLCFIE